MPQGSFVPHIGEPFTLVLNVRAADDPDGSQPPPATDLAPTGAERSALMYQPVQTALEAGAPRPADAQVTCAGVSRVAETAADGGECEPRGITSRAAGDFSRGLAVLGPVAFTTAEEVWMIVQAVLPDGSTCMYSFLWGASQEEYVWQPPQQGAGLKVPVSPKVRHSAPRLHPRRFQAREIFPWIGVPLRGTRWSPNPL